MHNETPNLSLPYISAAQAQKHVTHNEAIRALDALVQLSVIDRNLTTPPPSPRDGDRYIIPVGATGAWTGQTGSIAAYQDQTWAFHVPRAGFVAWVASDQSLFAYNGNAWALLSSGGGVADVNPVDRVGINTIADETNRLAIASPSSLFTHDASGDHRQIVNKQASAGTASTIYQRGYSGRAEIGLTGDDDFHFKVSADGATWRDALILVAATGTPRLPVMTSSQLPSASTSGAGALIYVSDLAEVRVSDGTQWRPLGSGSQTPDQAPLFIFIGESNSGGLALNSSATSDELAARSVIQIWNNSTSVFENLDIGTNNLLAHDGLTGQPTHSFELQLANAVALGRLDQARAYLVKCGQGGSQIAQWGSGHASGFWATASARITAALAAMQSAGKTPLPVVFLSIGLNDQTGSSTYSLPATTDWTGFRTNVQGLITRLRALLGANTPVMMTRFDSPIQIAANVNIELAAIDTADPFAVAVSSSGAAANGDGRHWSYAGFKLLTERMLDGWLALSETAVAPGISPAAGTYSGAQTITLTPASGALETRYTTDGTDPLVGTIYTAPFSVTPPRSVNARTIKQGAASALVTADYLSATVSQWLAADAGTLFALSNGNRTFVRNGTGAATAWRTIRGDTTRAAGKRYIEFKAPSSGMTEGGQVIFGFASTAHNAAQFVGQAANSGGWGAGAYRTNSGFTAAGGAISMNPVNGDTIMMSIFFADQKIWIGRNGAWLAGGDPASGGTPALTFLAATVGALHPAMSTFFADGSEGSWTLQSSASQFTHTPPAGFVAWDS